MDVAFYLTCFINAILVMRIGKYYFLSTGFQTGIYWSQICNFGLRMKFILSKRGLYSVFRYSLRWDLQPDNMAQASISLTNFSKTLKGTDLYTPYWQCVNNELTFGILLLFSPQVPLAIRFFMAAIFHDCFFIKQQIIAYQFIRKRDKGLFPKLLSYIFSNMCHTKIANAQIYF